MPYALRPPVVGWVPDTRFGRRPIFYRWPHCKSIERAAINRAFDYIHQNIIYLLDSWGGAASQLANCLRGRTTKSVLIYCNYACESWQAAWALKDRNVIGICGDALPPLSRTPLTATVFHELVHSCGGNELDAYALEYWLFKNNGAYLPSSTAFSRMCSESDIFSVSYRCGKFVCWSPGTGTVYLKDPRPDGTFGFVPYGPIIRLDTGWYFNCP